VEDHENCVSRTEELVEDEKPSQSSLVDTKVNVRTLLAMFWVCHLWWAYTWPTQRERT